MTTPQPPQPRRRLEYTALLEEKLNRMLENQTRLEVTMEQIRGSIMPRAEIDSEMEKRVSLAIYASDKLSFEERFKRLEDAPSATWSRAGILISGGIGCAGLLVAAVSILVTILVASHIIG